MASLEGNPRGKGDHDVPEFLSRQPSAGLRSNRSGALMVCAAAFVSAGLPLISTVAKADITGFDNLNPMKWKFNESDTGFPNLPDPNTLQIVNTNSDQARSVFNLQKQVVSSFVASFSVRVPATASCCNQYGLCFVVQNDSRGIVARGDSYGYSGITPSIAASIELEFNPEKAGIWSAGVTASGSPSTGLNFESGHKMQVKLIYDGFLLKERIVDSVTGNSFERNYPDVNIPLTAGGSKAFVGFSARSYSSGGSADIYISDFRFHEYCPSDFNKDNFVTADDFDAFVTEFIAGNAAADFNGDGFVTGDDFDAFVAAFVEGC